MHANDIVQKLGNPRPAWQHGNIRNEAHIPHELIALAPGVASKYPQLSFICREAENRVERRSLAGTVGTDDSQDAPFFQPQVHTVQRSRFAEGLAQAAR